MYADSTMRIPALTIDLLVAVIALAQQKSYKSAGEELSLTTSAVQKRIRTAERTLGQRLFIGTEEGVTLTPEGQLLYRDGLRAIEQILLTEEKAKALTDLRAGHLRVGHSTYLAPKLLALVMRLNGEKEMGLRIQHLPGLMTVLVKQVVDGTLHAAFGDLSITHSALIARQLFEEPIVVCTPKGHPLAVKAAIRPQDLDGEPVIAVSRDPTPAHHMEIKEFFEDFGVHLDIVADAFAPPEALIMVQQKIGICLLEASAVMHPELVAKPLSVRVLTRKSGLYVREDNRHPALNSFVDLVTERIGLKYRHRDLNQSGHSRKSSTGFA
jgi:DNA-binding transcriptional LysR family regulator